MRRLLSFSGLLVALLTVSACDASDLASLRIVVHGDLSGTIAASSIEHCSDRAGALGGGVDWVGASGVVVRRGSFASLAGQGLDLAGIRVTSPGSEVPGHRQLLVVLPRGDAPWTRAFAPVEDREALRAILDPDGKDARLGELLKIEIELPADCQSSVLIGKPAGFAAKTDGRKATLVVEIDTVRKGQGEVSWLLGWTE